MDEDYIFIKQFIDGDEKGFQMLVKKYQNRILNIVYSILGQDRESEDITQEVFIKVYKNLGSFKANSQFSTWLYRIAVNTTYDLLRKRKHFIIKNNVPEALEIKADKPQDILIKREKEEQIRKALEKLPFKYRLAVILKDIDGLPYIEIAKVLGCSIGTVESRLYRGRQLLRDILVDLKGEIE